MKTTTKEREAFDVREQRLDGTEAVNYKVGYFITPLPPPTLHSNYFALSLYKILNNRNENAHCLVSHKTYDNLS